MRAVADPLRPDFVEVTYSDGRVVEMPKSKWVEAQRRTASLWSDLGTKPPTEPQLSRPVPGSNGATSTKPMTPAELKSLRQKLNRQPRNVRQGALRIAQKLKTLPSFTTIGSRFIPVVGTGLMAYSLASGLRELLFATEGQQPDAATGGVVMTPLAAGLVIIQNGPNKHVSTIEGFTVDRENGQLFGIDDKAVDPPDCQQDYLIETPGVKFEVPAQTTCVNPITGALVPTLGRKMYRHWQPADPYFAAPGDEPNPATSGKPRKGEASNFTANNLPTVDNDWSPMFNDGVVMDEDMVDAIEWPLTQPESGLAPNEMPNPPGTVVIPEPAPGQKYQPYADILTGLGLQPANEPVPAEFVQPDLGPDAVLRTIPEAGTRVEKGTPVRVRTNPGDVGAPAGGGGAGSGCEPWVRPAIDFAPLKVGLTKVFPFGVPFWVADALDKWTGEPQTPEWTFEFPMAPGEGDMTVSLAIFDPHMPAIRNVFAVVAIVGMLWLFMSLAFGGPSSASRSDD